VDPKIRKIILIAFMIAVVATIIIYYATDKNMKYTWYAGGTAMALYLVYRFSKQ
jgi:bacteriorhodopsin